MKSEAKSNIVFAVVAADVACFRIVDEKLHVLLGRAPAHSPFAGRWALIGGMLHLKETAEEAVNRLLLEKAGIKNIYKRQVYTFSAINRDPRGRVVSVAYMALTNIDPQDFSKASLETKWVPYDVVPKLAYDHDEMFKHILGHLRLNLMNTDIAKHLTPQDFTLSELQKVYEAVLGEGIDKRNFRKKILNSGLLKSLNKKKKIGVMRPASVFRFR